MNPCAAVVIALGLSALSGCSLPGDRPLPPPPPGAHAIEISRQQAHGLQKMETISVRLRGSPDDIDREVDRQANARGARYYRIIDRQQGERLRPDVWSGHAVLYR